MSFITNITAGTPVTGAFGPNGVPSGADNNQGVVRGGGTVPTARQAEFKASSLGDGNPVVTIVSGVNVFAAGAGTWNGGTAVIVKATSSLAGISNNAALFGASDSAQGDSIHQAGVVRNRLYKTAVRAGNWNPLSGWSSDPTVANTGAWDIAASADDAPTVKASKTDHAANPTSRTPGALQYDLGQVPVQTGYQPKYLW
jgi:hypothetical protein|tara:strand:- start:400 stop:996 length:597 start_codon:yes stop_codon:yes gene_type:complete